MDVCIFTCPTAEKLVWGLRNPSRIFFFVCIVVWIYAYAEVSIIWKAVGDVRKWNNDEKWKLSSLIRWFWSTWPKGIMIKEWTMKSRELRSFMCVFRLDDRFWWRWMWSRKSLWFGWLFIVLLAFFSDLQVGSIFSCRYWWINFHFCLYYA